MRVFLSFGVVGLVGLLAIAAVEWLPQTLHYPYISYAAADSLVLSFIKHGKRTDTECRQAVSALRDILAKSCPTCVREARCIAGLDSESRSLLSNTPMPMPTARLADGVVAYASSIEGLALSVCRQSERATMTLPERQRAKCYAKGESRQ